MRKHLAWVLMLLVTSVGWAQQRTTIQDTLLAPDGSLLKADVLVTSGTTFKSADGFIVSATAKTRINVTNGQLNIALVPNIGATPAGTYYQVLYTLQNGGQYKETWVVPGTPSLVNLAAVRALSPPVPTVLVAMSQVVPPQNCDDKMLRWRVNGWVCITSDTDFTWNIQNPVLDDSGLYQHKIGYVWKPMRVSCSFTGTGSVQINLEARLESDPDSTGTSILTTPVPCSSLGTTVSTDFQVVTVDAYAPIALMVVGAPTGPGMLRVFVHATPN
jgi:hypothetical protein